MREVRLRARAARGAGAANAGPAHGAVAAQRGAVRDLAVLALVAHLVRLGLLAHPSAGARLAARARLRTIVSGEFSPFPPAVAHRPLLSYLTAAIE